MEYTWTGDVKLFVPGVGTIPPHSTFEMGKESLKMAGVVHLLKTGEIKKGNVPKVEEPDKTEGVVPFVAPRAAEVSDPKE